ncbi:MULTISPECIES: LysR family transcriptional regulator [unclassified Bradyrhizobium]|uniref:LysR family transcriptional regulator n=1 Tax=unclassified Bradyrhizobium TaxID=2631580 RepID=UPI0004265092|nr:MULTISPECIES: LysR family transcriptional regulator [unclassified Bradyrhizobium]QIG97329.1 LysR family transcriptional regulator [Bradyrhizobium sp. 6(2017)]
MDIRHARTFVAVAESGTVSKAAQQLRIAQPALSRQIANLEQEFGLKLFDRIRGRLTLTGEGEQLLGDCRALLNQADVIRERAEVLRSGETGVLRLAASPQFIEGVISPFWHQYTKRYPNVHVVMIEALGWPHIRDLLERGDIHLGQNLLSAVPKGDTRYASVTLKPVDQLAAFHPTLAIRKSATIEIAELASHPLLLLDNNFVFRRTFDAACRLAHLEINVKFESRTPHTLMAMAEDGHGVAIIPSAVRAMGYKLRIAGVTFQKKPLREPIALFWDRQRTLPRYANAFCDMLADFMKDAFPVTRPSERMRTGARGR